MSFNYNNEVLDLLLKKTLGSSYTSSDLVSGQETPVLPKIQNSQIFTNRITDKNSSNFTWSSSSNVTGGGTVKYLDVVTGETATFQYIKKYEAIPMSVVAGTDYRAWKPTASGMQEKFQNVILGKPNFSFSITTDITNYETIYSTNSGYKPVINNGILVFFGNSVPSSTTVISMREVFVYEGAFGTTTGMLITDMANVTITSPQDGQALVYDNATQKWIAGTVGGDYIPISTLETLDDVSLNNLAVGQTIGYDGFKWIPKNVPIDLSDISDVNLSGATDGQAIVYDDASGNWKPANVQTPLIQLSDISDVKFDDGPYDGQGLVWKDVSSCWIAKDIQTPLNSLGDVSGVDLSGIVAGQTIVLDISGVFVPKTVGEVIENLSDLKDVDVSNLADQIPQWTQKNRLEASDAAVSDNFGFASALDISYALVGSPNANSSTAADVGKAYLYLKNFFLGTYSEDQVLMSTINSGNMNFGYSVTISQTNLIIGAPNHSYNPGSGFKEKAGTVFFYNYNSVQEKWGVVNGSYYNENSKIQPGVANDQFGYSIDIDVSGVWCIIGSPQQLSNGNGKANIYENVSETWTHRKALTASDGAAGDNFGVSVRINDENTFAFVGADNHDSAKGAVYVFKKNHPNANDWGQYQKIVSLDQRINSYFGKSIGVNGNSLLIGSPNSGNFSGAVYEVTYSTGTGKWGTASGNDHLPSSDKIVALDASANDQYGYSVDVYDNFGVVGSKSTDMSGNVDTGSAYIIINTGEGYWEESKQVNPGDLDVQDEYGISVGIYGRSIVIGSWLSEGDQGGDPAHAGSAYIFNLPNPEGGTKALIYDTDYNRWKVGSVAPSDEAVVTKLGLLEDVDVTTIANDNVLAYDDASGNWTATTMGSLLTIGDISDVDLSGVATGNAIIWDASLNKWIVGDAGGGSASGVTSTNIQPTGEDVTAGQLYYDSSWNSFHGRTTGGWKEIMLSNTNLLFGSAPIPKKQPGEVPLLVVFPDRYEFSWENPPQYSTGFSASNGSDYVNGDLYLPVINHIKFEFFETSDNETWGSTSRGTVTIGGKSSIGRGSINGNTTQTLSNISGVNKITNKLILYSTGSGAAVGVSDGWTNLNTASGASYEYDFVNIDASGNQAYYFNPRSSNFSIDAQTPYSFRMWLENSVTPHTYRIWGSITTQVVGSPTKIKIADVGQTNGFYATIIRESNGVHKIKVVVPPTALTAAGVEVTASETGIDDSVFFEAYEVQYQTVNAQTNENTETSAITGWSGTGNDNWTGEESVEQIFDEGSSGLDHYSCIPADTPLQNKNNITVNVSKNITIPQFNNKFYRFRVRAKNQVGTDFGPWTTDYYVVRFTRPQQMAWNTSSPPLFLTKVAHPDKWYITLTWQDTKSSNGGVSTGDDDWQHTNLGVAEFKLTRTTDNGSNYSVADNENGDLTQSSAKLTYDYIVASSTDATQKWSDPQYKFKIQARNYLFGTSSNDAGAWSTISTATVSLIPTTPVTPTHLQLKFYEQSQTNGTNPASYYTADPWTAPTFDYTLYQWDINFDNTGSGYGTADYNGVTIGAANKLTPEQYQLEFLAGKANISGTTLRLVPTTENTGSYNDFKNSELLAGDYYRLGTGTTVYQVSSVSSDVKKHILNHTGSETGITEIYKIVYVNATDKNLPGANPYYTRDYNKEGYANGTAGLTSLVRGSSFTYTVKGKNYFVSTASSGFSSPGPYSISSPSAVQFTTTPTIEIRNDEIRITINEPEKSAESTYSSTPALFNTPDAIDYNSSMTINPYINNVDKGSRFVYTTATSATPRVPIVNHLLEDNSNALYGMVEGTTSTIKYIIRAENLINISTGAQVEATFKLLRPAPTNMDAIPIFEWVSDGTNNIKLTLRRSTGGLTPSTSPNSTGSAICPVTSVSATGANLTNKIQASTDQLFWQVKSSVAITSGITASWSHALFGGAWTNTDCVVGNIGTLTEDQEYEIFFRLKNRYITDYKESTSPKIKLTKPNAPDFQAGSALLDIVDDNETSNSGLNTFSFTWVKPTQPGLHYQHDGAADTAALTAHPNQPYIEKYKIYVTDSTNSINYSFYVTGGSTSVECPVTVTIVGEVDNIGGGKFVILPDIAYTNIKISAYNVRLTTEGTISNPCNISYVTGSTRIRNYNLTNASYGVPYTIVDQDREYDSSYKTSITLGGDYTYGNQAALANGNGNVSTVKNWNTITTTTTTNFGPVLLNARKNKPGNNPIMSWYVQVGASDPGPDVTRLTNGTLTTTNSYGYLKGVNAVDVFGDTHNNSDQWYKTNIMYFEINRTEMLADTGAYGFSGSPITIKFGIKYYDQNSSTTSWGADITACTSQYFGTCNVVTAISGTPTVSYTPYKITGIPTLYPGKTQTIIPSYTIDNKTDEYINNDYIAKITLDDGTFSTFMDPAKKTGLSNFTWPAWPPSVFISKAASNTFDGGYIAATSTSNIIQSKTVKLKIDHKNLFGDGTTHIMKVSGTSNDYYFIYDKNSYNLIDTSTTNGMGYTHLLMNYNGSAAHQQNTTSFSGYRALTPVNPPNAKFNPATEISNSHISGSSYTSSSDWTYGTFTGATDVTAATCNGLAFYNGKYQSPAYLKSTNTYGLAANANNYPLLSTWYNNYSTTVSSDNVWANSNNYRDNYRWAFWKFKAQNGTFAGVQPVESQIYLANGNNDNDTNINFSDLTSTEADGSGTSPNVKICIKTYYISSSTPKVSSWNQIVSGNSTTSPGNLNATQLTSSTFVPATGNGNSGNLSWTGSTSSKNIIDYSELGSAIPTDSTWKSENRPLPFLHGASTLLTSAAMWHIIAVGIKNNSAKYIGNIYISPKYDAAV